MGQKIKYKILTDTNDILYIGESEEPFEELHKFKRRTFSDVFNTEFRHSTLRWYLKRIINNGGTIKIEIQNKFKMKKTEFTVIEYHKGLFNPKIKTHTTVSEFDNEDDAQKHYDKVKDNCQRIILSKIVKEYTN